MGIYGIENPKSRINRLNELEVYKLSKEAVKIVYNFTKTFPHTEKYGLCDQLRRAVISIAANIAEGQARQSKKDQAHFFRIYYCF